MVKKYITHAFCIFKVLIRVLKELTIQTLELIEASFFFVNWHFKSIFQ